MRAAQSMSGARGAVAFNTDVVGKWRRLAQTGAAPLPTKSDFSYRYWYGERLLRVEGV